LAGGAKLILSAPAGAQFVVNITGVFQLSGGSQIVLQGGLGPYDVLYYKGTQNVIFSGGSKVTGIMLGPYVNISPDAGTLTGEVIGGGNGHTIQIASGEIILHPPVCP